MKMIFFVGLFFASPCFAQPFDYENGNRYVIYLENGKKVVDGEQSVLIGPDGCLHHLDSGKRVKKIVEINDERTPRRKEYQYCDLRKSDEYWKESDKRWK